MRGEEDVYEMPVGNLGWVEIDLHGLRVVAHAVVGGVVSRTAGVSHSRSYDSRDGAKLRLCAPESAESECRGLEVLRRRLIHRGHRQCGRGVSGFIGGGVGAL